MDLTATTPDGIRLSASSTGVGTPIVLIPGLVSSRQVYRDLIERLATKYLVISFDPRGIGESDWADGPYTMEMLAADVIAVLDAADTSEAVVWGASMGGMVAQRFGLNFPDRVTGLVLACTGPGGEHAIRADQEATRALIGKGAESAGEAYRIACTVLYAEDFQKEHPDFIEQEIAYRNAHPVRARTLKAQWDAVKRHDAFDELPHMAVPTLVMHGSEDVVMPPGNGELLVERIPGAKKAWFAGRGHLFFHEDLDATVTQLSGFVDSLSVASSV